MTSLFDIAQSPSGYTNIPMEGQNPEDQATKAVSLASMIQGTQLRQNALTQSNIETSDMLATRQAIAGATTQDPNTGQPTTDLPSAVAALSKTSPTAALNLQLSMAQRQSEVALKQADLIGKQTSNTQSQVNLVSGLMLGVQNDPDPPTAYARLKQNAANYGLDPTKMPATYDPVQAQQFINQSLTTSQALNNKIETTRLGLTATKNTADIRQMDATATNEVTGQYQDNPATKEYVNIANTYQSMKSMQASGQFSQGVLDRDLLYNFQNIINPNRSATSGTIEQDEEARSTLQSFGVDFNKVINGASLSPSQRQQITSFAENKFRDATANQQVLYNNAQNRLVSMRAQGRDVDPVNSLPEYGATVTGAKGSKTWVGVHNVMDNYPQGTPPTGSVPTEGTIGRKAGMQPSDAVDIGMIPPISASAIVPQTQMGLKGNPNKVTPPPPQGQAGEPKVMTGADIIATAKASGKSEQEVRALAEKSGYTVSP